MVVVIDTRIRVSLCFGLSLVILGLFINSASGQAVLPMGSSTLDELRFIKMEYMGQYISDRWGLDVELQDVLGFTEHEAAKMIIQQLSEDGISIDDCVEKNESLDTCYEPHVKAAFDDIVENFEFR